MKLSSILLILILASTTLFAKSDHIRFKALPTQSSVNAGDEFDIQLNVELDDYWYTYSTELQLSDEGIGPSPTEIMLKPSESLELIDIKVPKPKNKYDDGFEMNIDYYNGQLQFVVQAKALSDLNFENDSAFVNVYIQICDTVRCLPPEEYDIRIGSETVESAFPTFVPSTAGKKETKVLQTESSKEIEDVKKKGVWSFLWFAMSAGALALLTPCVFPMIPITVSFFTKRAEKNPGKGLRDSLIYAIGIIFTFVFLGFLLSILFGATGIRDFASNGWVNLFIAAIFVIFALNLFGAFEIQVPTGLMNKLNAKSQGGGIIGVLLMGLTFSLTSFTCTVPFVGTALLSATGGEWFYPIIGMLGFAGVFAAPFFLLALFPSLLTSLPKAGGWMNNVKVVMGFLEIAAAIKFISNADLVWAWGVLPREVFLSIWIACGILIVIYILGKFQLKLDTPLERVGAVRVIWVIIFTSISVYLLSGLYGRPLGELDAFLPPSGYLEGTASNSSGSSSGSSYTETNWEKDYETAVAKAKAEGKPLFIDFTGWTCTNCRWMESNMFPDGDVAGLMNEMVKVKLYTDRRKEPELSNKKLQEDRFNSIELPLYVILTPDEELVGTKAFTRDKQEFVDFLKRGLY